MKDGAGGSPYIKFAFPYSMMKVTTILITAACLAGSFSLYADAVSDREEAASSTGAYSVAGALRLPENVTKRDVYGMNVGWKLFKGGKVPEEAAGPDVDDSSWESVNLPNGIELLPEEASGCSNYQGPVWYRKTFIPPSRLEGRRNTLYFEGIMGKSEIWVNGEKAAEHFGGYLPVIVNLDKWLKPGQKNVIAVKADNSNDASYPPGKPQEGLDFSYFGGIYRDVYLISTGPVYITDPNEANTVAGGGVFFRTESLDPFTRKGKVGVKVQVANQTDKEQKVRVQAVMTDPKGGGSCRGDGSAGHSSPFHRRSGYSSCAFQRETVVSGQSRFVHVERGSVGRRRRGSGQRFGPSAGQPFHEGRRPDGGNDGKGIGAQWVSVF